MISLSGGMKRIALINVFPILNEKCGSLNVAMARHFPQRMTFFNVRTGLYEKSGDLGLAFLCNCVQ